MQTRMDQRKKLVENGFWHFSNTKINTTNRAQKVDEKIGIIFV